jgi:multicomponent Na+:H+ antiporter subunit F
MSPSAFLHLAIQASFVMLTASMVLVFARMLRGPTLCNRVVAFDLMTMLMVCAMGAYIIRTDEAVLIQVIILAALITFLGTVGYAYYVERSKQ